MRKHKYHVGFRLDEETYSILKQLEQQYNRPYSEILRMLIYATKNSKCGGQGMGMGNCGMACRCNHG